jgi:hypothetical protein
MVAVERHYQSSAWGAEPWDKVRSTRKASAKGV